jgi:elongation factor P
MASLIEAIDIKRKMYFELEGAPYHCLDVDVSKPTARGGQTLVRIKMRNLLTRAVFDRTFKAGEKFREPDLVDVTASFLYADAAGYHFMDQESFDTISLRAETVGDDRHLLVDNVLVQIQKFNGNPIGLQLPPHVELTVTYTGLELRVPLFIKEGERIKVHTETREFAGRA